MKILKFGGKSLGSEEGFENVIQIIQKKSKVSPVAVVVSAIGDTTDTLENILEEAKKQNGYLKNFKDFRNRSYHKDVDLTEEFELLRKVLEGVSLTGDYSPKIKDLVLAQGELLSIKILTNELKNRNIQAIPVDSRDIFIAEGDFGQALINEEKSKKNTKTYFKKLKKAAIPVVSGFIAKTEKGETATFGRNGSNYSASLLAKFLNADELENYTHVDGIYTANPDWVKNAQKINELSFNDANELASFGASILHAKTILPLIQNKIPLRILNTLNPEGDGTLISARPGVEGVKSISLQLDVALIQLEGEGLLGKVGVDARIFTALGRANVSVGLISQGTSERGLGFLVKGDDAEMASDALKTEFQADFHTKDVESVTIRKDVAVISIIGQELSSFDKAYSALVKNKIVPILFANAVTGKNVSLLVDKKDGQRALNVIHGQIFGISKNINLALFGHGNVGAALIDQILTSAAVIESKKDIRLNIFAIANSKKILFDENGIGKDWKERFATEAKNYHPRDVSNFADLHHLENRIAVDNTASLDFTENYIPLVKNGFDLVSSNKIANTLSYKFYKDLRENLKINHKEYLYETNVGAGLPLIDTIKLLHFSGENITKIKGVFSGSLSYIFNRFSSINKSFSEILKEAIEKGFTEPDPREDLSGNDVGRKLLILARELDLQNEWAEVSIQNMIPKELQSTSTKEFLQNLDQLNFEFEPMKKNLNSSFVLRYIGELSGDLQGEKGILEAKLIAVPENSVLGRLKGSDTLFEIYTENYGDNPIVIQGAGAGAKVTARGVFGDILRLADK